jgi:hypothetical protein
MSRCVAEATRGGAVMIVLLIFALILVILEYVITKEKGLWGLALIVGFLITFIFLIPADFIIIVGMSLCLFLIFGITYYLKWFIKKRSVQNTEV